MPSCALVLTLFLFQKGQGFFPSLPIAALLRRQLSEVELKWRKLGCCCAAWLALPRQRPAWFWNPCWPSLRAMRPVAEWRSVHANKQGITLNPRAARPVAERRYLRSQLACLPSTPAPYGRGVGSRGTTPCARPVAERRYLRSQLACLPSTPAPYGRGVRPRGTTPCARPVAERR